MTIEDVIDTYGDMVTRICIMNLRNRMRKTVFKKFSLNSISMA